MWSRLTESAQWAMWAADEAARYAGEKKVTPRHFLLGILSQMDELRVPLSHAGIDFDRLEAAANASSHGKNPVNTSLDLDPVAKQIIDLAATEATNQRMTSIDVGHFFIAILAMRPDFLQAAVGAERDIQVVREAVRSARQR